MARNLMCGEYIGRDGYIRSSRPLPGLLADRDRGGAMGCKYGHVCMLQPPGPHWVPAECAVSDCDKAEEELIAEVNAACRLSGTPPLPTLEGYTFRDCVGPWLYELHKGADGHVTVECHCPRCERERGGVERNADGTPYKVGESGCGSAQRSD